MVMIVFCCSLGLRRLHASSPPLGYVTRDLPSDLDSLLMLIVLMIPKVLTYLSP
jgi:hypothetical protein